MPEIDAGELLHLGFIFFLGARSFPKLFLHLPQAPRKEDELELHQALTTIFKTFLVLHSSSVSPSPSPIYPYYPRLEPLEPLSPLMT